MTDLPGTRLNLPLPPSLSEALGYPGDARYVVFFIDGDEVMYTDGVRTGDVARWAFQAYTRHPAVEPLLRPFDLKRECLVIDQEGCKASVCNGSEAAEFLREVRPPLRDGPVEELPGLGEQLRSGWQEVPAEEVYRAMNEQRGRVGRMLSWLDLCPEPGEGREK